MLAACAQPKPYALSQRDAERFGSRLLRIASPKREPRIFGLADCVLYKARTANQQIAGWDVVLASDWGQSSYPKWMTVCTSESLRYDGRYVIVDMCAQAIGAGGGCAGGGGTYRSRTGDAQGWEIRSDAGWLPLPK